MSISCVNCSSCGKCYDKHSTCSVCGADINLQDESCFSCGEPVTEEMREAARQLYLKRKREEREALFPGIKANREKRQQWLQSHAKGRAT